MKNGGIFVTEKVTEEIKTNKENAESKKQYIENVRLDTYRVDKNKIGKASGIWQLMQEAACHQMEVQKPSYSALLAEGKALMLARVDLAIPEEIFLDEDLISSSWPCQSSRATFLRNYVLQRNGQTVAIADTQWSLVDVESRKILKVSDADFSNYWMGEHKLLIGEKFKIFKETAESMHEAGGKTVCYSDIDYNGHMNNTYYLDVLCDFIPELAAGTHRVSFVRIHYSKEAPLGDRLKILSTSAITLSEDEKKEYGVPAEKKYIFRTEKAEGELNTEAEIVLAPIENKRV